MYLSEAKERCPMQKEKHMRRPSVGESMVCERNFKNLNYTMGTREGCEQY